MYNMSIYLSQAEGTLFNLFFINLCKNNVLLVIVFVFYFFKCVDLSGTRIVFVDFTYAYRGWNVAATPSLFTLSLSHKSESSLLALLCHKQTTEKEGFRLPIADTSHRLQINCFHPHRTETIPPSEYVPTSSKVFKGGKIVSGFNFQFRRI